MNARVRLSAEKDRGPRATPPTPAPKAMEPARPAGMPNLAVLSSLGLRAKLTVSHPFDADEREADRIADRVVRMPEPLGTTGTLRSSAGTSEPQVRRYCADCEQGEPAGALLVSRADNGREVKVDRQEDAGSAPHAADHFGEDIQALRGRGSPLPAVTRRFFEPRFDADFGDVRVHTDGRAERTAEAINARAFAVGTDIAFARGQYAPDSDEGRKLLAHELAHVVQQTGVTANASQPSAGLGRKDDTLSRQPGNASPGPLREEAPAEAPVLAQPAVPALEDEELSDSQTGTARIRRSIFSDVWEGLTNAAPAVLNAASTATSLIARLAANPSLAPMVVSAIAWDIIPDRLKGPIIDRILRVLLVMVRAVEPPSPPGLPIGTIVKHAAIGFLERALNYTTGMKVRVADRMARIVTNPSFDFSLGYLKGIVIGLWDGLTGPFILLWDLVKIGYEIQSAQMRFISRLLHREERERLGRELGAVLARVEAKIGQVVGQLMAGRNSPLAIVGLIQQLVNAALRQVEALGTSLADALLRFLNRADRELGEALGWVSGTLTFEVLLLVLTEGGYTILKNSLQGLRVVVRLIEAGAQAWEALAPIRAALAGFRSFAVSNRALAPLVEAVEEVFVLLVRFLRFSYGLGGPAAGAARAGEHGAAAAERGAAREFRVADTAMRETHEFSLLADGRIIRCSDRCLEMTASIRERAATLTRARMSEESQRLITEAEQLAAEARALKADEALSDAERAARERALTRRVESLERQTAAAEREALLRLRDPHAARACRTILERNAGDPRLRQFEPQVERLQKDIRDASGLLDNADPELRQLAADELQRLDQEARELFTQMRRAEPPAPTGALVPAGERRYAPTAKHQPGGWGTLMDLDDATAQRVLNQGLVGPNGRQVYSYHNGRMYEFQPDGVGGFHGYPVPGTEVPVPVLRQLRDQGIITQAEYRRLLRGA